MKVGGSDAASASSGDSRPDAMQAGPTGEADESRPSFDAALSGLRALRARQSAQHSDDDSRAESRRAVALLERASGHKALVPSRDLMVLDELEPAGEDSAPPNERMNLPRLYREADSDTEWLIEPLELDHAVNALRAARLDEAFGNRTCDFKVVIDESGQAYLAVRNDPDLVADPNRLLDPEQSDANGVFDGFVGDALLGNRSVLGKQRTGIQFSRERGEAVRANFKGALHYFETGKKSRRETSIRP